MSQQFVTDGGLETDLIFHHGVDLPEFAAFPLVEDETGREVLTRYYDGYADVAAKAGVGLMLDAPTWRANPDWAANVGYDATALDRVNRAAIEFMQGLGEQYRSELGLADVRVGGLHGPRGDGYIAGEDADPDEAADYHCDPGACGRGGWGRPGHGADHDRCGRGDRLRPRRSRRRLPAAVGFTVETDGRLPDGTSLRDAIARVDAEARRTTSSSTAPTRLTSPGLDGDGDRRRLARPDRGPAPQRVPDVPRRARRGAGARRGRPGRARERRRPTARDAAEPAHRRRLLRHRQPPRRRALGV